MSHFKTVLRNVLLPVEHGASVMFGESVLAGLWVAFSAKGLLPALGWILLFLMGHPLKIAIKNYSLGFFDPRTIVARWCSGVLLIAACLCFLLTYFSSGPMFFLVLGAFFPLAAIHFWAVFHDGKKDFAAELFGALSLGAAGATIYLASGSSLKLALAIWIVLAVRAGTSIVYVRERLRFSRGQESRWGHVFLVHVLGLFVLGGLIFIQWVKPYLLFAGILLWIRLGFIRRGSVLKPQDIGLQESVLGFGYVVLMAVSFGGQ